MQIQGIHNNFESTLRTSLLAGGLVLGAEKSGIVQFTRSYTILDARKRKDWGKTKKEARGPPAAQAILNPTSFIRLPAPYLQPVILGIFGVK